MKNLNKELTNTISVLYLKSKNNQKQLSKKPISKSERSCNSRNVKVGSLNNQKNQTKLFLSFHKKKLSKIYKINYGP